MIVMFLQISCSLYVDAVKVQDIVQVQENLVFVDQEDRDLNESRWS